MLSKLPILLVFVFCSSVFSYQEGIAKNDAIEDTIDYKKITKGIIKFVEGSEFQLQETLAEGIADLVKNKYKVDSLKLRVSKPGALRHAEDVGVIIHR